MTLSGVGLPLPKVSHADGARNVVCCFCFSTSCFLFCSSRSFCWSCNDRFLEACEELKGSRFAKLSPGAVEGLAGALELGGFLGWAAPFGLKEGVDRPERGGVGRKLG